MKKLLAVLLIILALLGLAERIFQSHWGKEIAYNLLAKNLAESGFSIKIEKIEGSLPSAIVLRNVEFESDQIIVSIESLETNLSLLALFKKELTFSELRANGIVVEEKEPLSKIGVQLKKEIPFSIKLAHFDLKNVSIPHLPKADFQGHFLLKKGKNFSLDTTAIAVDFPDITTHWVVKGKKRGILDIKGEIQSPWIEDLHLSATVEIGDGGGIQKAYIKTKGKNPQLEGNITLTKEDLVLKGNAILRSSYLPFQPLSIRSLGTNTEFLWDGETLSGNSVGSGEIFSKIWTGKTDFSWKKGESLSLPSWDLHSGSIDAKGHLEITPDKDLLGQVILTVDNLQDLSSATYGKLELKGEWKEGKEMEIDGKAFDFYWKDLFCQSIAFYSDVRNSWEKLEGEIYLDIAFFKWRSLFLETIGLSIESNDEGLYPFKLFTEGEWTHPLELHLDGLMKAQNQIVSCDIENGTGSFFNHPLTLSHPVHIEKGMDTFFLSNLDLDLSNAHLFGFIEQTQEERQAQLILQNFPLDVLSLNPLDLAIQGKTNLEVNVKEIKNNLSGDFKAVISDLEISSLEDTKPVMGSGEFQGVFNQERLQLKGNLKKETAPLFSCNLSLPIHLNLWPFTISPLYDQKIKGNLSFDGPIEEITDFFNLGFHRISGQCNCNFQISNTFDEPRLKGSCIIKDGFYENYFTGTQIRQIQAEWKGNKDRLLLESMTGLDSQQKGKFKATGEISLRYQDLFPFHFDVELNRFNAVQIDLVTADTNGKIQIDGNLKRATASGTVEVVESELLIPNRIPQSFPRLEVVYRNAIKPIVPPPLPALNSYPLQLDLSIQAPDAVFITGRGLESEWRGNFQIDGTPAAVATEGKLELIKGHFVMSGRSFLLTEGSLLFTGRPDEMPYLNLAGSMNIKDVVITARLKGPLKDPQITLQSSPPLPLSTIMAYLLFGQDLAEINSYQALQLANSLTSLAGEGPDILENTRRSLGVDRLTLVTVPSKDDEVGDRIALQVGKYISEGILVSLSQGAEESSTNISIEIEITGGFVFQLESDQQQEQGKFTIKWNHNY